MPERIPLALCPGLLLDRRLWQHQIPALADIAECRVPDFSTQDSIGAMARAVLKLMPQRFALAGLSMGGYVALEVVAQAPERVTHLALLDTRAVTDTPEEAARRRGLMELSQKGQFKGVTPKLLPLLLHPANLKNQPLTRLVMEMAESIGREAFQRQQKALLNRVDRARLLPTIVQPTLVLCGRQDTLTPLPLSQAMARAIPDAKLVVVEDSGHLTPLEQPQAVNRALREWLTH
jgi:pimeloyl-ACP methyl ester carboxylesterase